MFDLGTGFLAAVERTPSRLALVDSDLRLDYATWYRKISSLVAHFDDAGLKPGDHLVSVVQNTWQAATLHWACQFAGIVVTPINWRAVAEDVDFTISNAGARAIVWDSSAESAISQSKAAESLIRLCADDFAELLTKPAADARPRASADDLSLMLYTSGTTAKPKGVPRRHRAERAAAVAHVAQNAYLPGEITLGVMPLYHTMGVRSLLAMTLVSGTFICLPAWSAETALRLMRDEEISNLYLVPTLYHDLLEHPDFSAEAVKSVCKIGFAGASMTDDLLQRLAREFKPELFVNHYGSSEIYTFTIDPDPVAKPGSAGRAGINGIIRVVPMGSDSADVVAQSGEEGEIVASLLSDEAFEGYWQRPEADAKALRDGWYFTGDTGYVDEDGDLFVTGRVDDMIITGGENVSPVEIESCLSLHDAVEEVAVVGLADERWGKKVTAFIKRRHEVSVEELDAHCLASDLARFKRPREYIFVTEVPKSPVGKLLRRMLISGDYTPE